MKICHCWETQAFLLLIRRNTYIPGNSNANRYSTTATTLAKIRYKPYVVSMFAFSSFFHRPRFLLSVFHSHLSLWHGLNIFSKGVRDVYNIINNLRKPSLLTVDKKGYSAFYYSFPKNFSCNKLKFPGKYNFLSFGTHEIFYLLNYVSTLKK